MFFDRKLGMFLHWGIYAVGAWQEQELGRLGRDEREYSKYALQFNPVDYDPDAWLDEVQNAGMEYVCFTTKHHDGFCMWDTATTDYKITNTPYGKDVLKQLAEACARRGVRLSLYYSNPDWHNPDAYNPLSSHQVTPPEGYVPDFERYIEYLKAQITELMTNYGPIAELFWDINPKLQRPEINELVRKLQPGIYINDRGWDAGDYFTPERRVPDGQSFTRLTEACQSVGAESWGFRANEDYFSAHMLISSITEIFVRGGNYLLNIGPDARGNIPPKALELVRRIGKWHKSVREAFEGTQWVAMQGEPYYLMRRGNVDYLLFARQPTKSGYPLGWCTLKPERVTLLNDGRALPFAIDRMPWRYSEHAGVTLPDCLHVWDMPVDDFSNEVMVLKLEFADERRASDETCANAAIQADKML